MSETLQRLDPNRSYSMAFRDLWPRVCAWVRPYYDSEHLFHTVKWLLELNPNASEAVLLAAATHDMERHFPDGTQPDKASGAWDDADYNRRHSRRSADVVMQWLRDQHAPDELVVGVEQPILEHEVGGSPEGNILQAADSLSFLDVNSSLVSSWVLKGETDLEKAISKLDWMLERIQIDRGRDLARPLHARAVAAVRADVRAAGAGAP
jgi:hypothetical protein